MNQEVAALREELEDITVHLAEMLEACLHFAGVKDENIEDAVKIYIDTIDEVFEDDEGEMGYQEIVKTIEFMKVKKPILFG